MPNDASTVDQRIVEMRIDNEKFEAGAKKTISILESLDKSLNGLGNQTGEGFDSMSSSLEKVTDKFSIMGTIGDQVMRNLTNQAIELLGNLKNMATMLTTQQIGKGFDKYAEKTSAVQTIMAATSKYIGTGPNSKWKDQEEQMAAINAQLDRLNKFTDETSYNFVDMVGNIGKFTSNGRDLEESVTAMEGIANWAAISGGKVQDASRAMYNLSQALGMGAVTAIDWKSIENANMATYEFKEMAIEAAEKLGMLRKVSDGVWETTNKAEKAGVEVTVEGFREALRYKWFSSDVLLDVLGTYGEFTDALLASSDAYDIPVTKYLELIDIYDEGKDNIDELRKTFSEMGYSLDELMPDLEKLTSDEYDLGRRAFRAAQEAKTFAEAIDATKDAVSTGWMNVFQKIFGDYLEAKEFWTAFAETLYDIFASPLETLNDIADTAFTDNAFFKVLNENGELIDVKKLETVEDFINAITGSDDAFRSFQDAAKKTNFELDSYYDNLYNLAKRQNVALDVDPFVEKYGSLSKAINEGAVSASELRKALLTMINDPNIDGDEIAKTFALIFKDVDPLAFFTGGEMLREALTNVMTFFSDLAELVGKAMENVFGDSDTQGYRLRNIIFRFWEWSKSLKSIKERTDDITKVLEVPLKILRSIWRITSLVFKVASKGLKFIFNIISPFLPMLATALEYLADVIDFAIELFSTLQPLQALFGGIRTAFQWIGDHIYILIDGFKIVALILMGVFSAAGIALSFIIEQFTALGSSVWDAISGSEELEAVWKSIKNKAETVWDVFSGLANDIKEGFSENGAKGAFDAFVESVSDGFKKIIPTGEGFRTFFSNLWSVLSTGFGAVGVFFSNLWNSLFGKEATSEIEEGAENTESVLSQVLNTIANIFMTVFGAIGMLFSSLWNAIFGKETTDELEEGAEKTESIFERIQRTFTTAFTTLLGNPEDVWQNIKNFFAGVWNYIVSILSEVKLSDIFKAIKLSVLSSFLFQLTGVFSQLKKLFSSVKEIPLSIKGVFEQIGETLSSLSLSFRGTALIKFAAAVGILTIAIYALTKLAQNDPEDKLTHVATIIGILMILLARVADFFSRSKALQKINIQQISVIPEAAAVLFGLAAVLIGLAIAVHAIKKIGNAKRIWEVISPILVIIGMLGIFFAAVTWMLKDLKAENISGLVKTMSAISFATMAFALAISMLITPIIALMLADRLLSTKIRDDKGHVIGRNNDSGLATAVNVIAGIFLAMAIFIVLFIAATKNMNPNTLKAIGAAMLGIAASMILIAFAIQMLMIPIVAIAALLLITKLQVPLAIALGAIIVILGLILLFYGKLVKSLSQIDANKISKIGGLIIKIAASMIVIALAIQLLIVPILVLTTLVAAVGWEKVAIALVGFLAVIAVLGFVFTRMFKALAGKRSNPEELSKFGNALIKFALAILIFNVAILVITPTLFMLSSAMIALATAAVKSKKVSTIFKTIASSIGKFVLLAAGIVLLGAGVALLGVGLLAAGLGALSFGAAMFLVAAGLSALMKVLPAFVDMVKGFDGKTIGGIMAVAVVVRALASLLGSFAKGDKVGNGLNKILNAIKSIGKTIGSFAKDSLKKFFKAFTDPKNREVIIGFLSTMIVTIGLYIIGVIPTLTRTIFDAILALINSLTTELHNHKDQIIESFTGFIREIVSVLGGVLDTLFSGEFREDMTGGEKFVFWLGTFVVGTEVLSSWDTLGSIFGRIGDALIGFKEGGALEGFARLFGKKSSLELETSITGKGLKGDVSIEAKNVVINAKNVSGGSGGGAVKSAATTIATRGAGDVVLGWLKKIFGIGGKPAASSSAATNATANAAEATANAAEATANAAEATAASAGLGTFAYFTAPLIMTTLKGLSNYNRVVRKDDIEVDTENEEQLQSLIDTLISAKESYEKARTDYLDNDDDEFDDEQESNKKLLVMTEQYKILSQYLDLCAESLGVTTEELNAQLESVEWNITETDAYKNHLAELAKAQETAATLEEERNRATVTDSLSTNSMRSEMSQLRNVSSEDISRTTTNLETATNLSEQLLSNVTEAKSNATDILTSFVSDLMANNQLGQFAGELEEAGISYGEFFGDGLGDGLDKMQEYTSTHGESLMNELLGRMALAGGIASPSTITTGYGEFLGEGLGIGLDNRTEYVLVRVDAIMKAVMNRMSALSANMRQNGTYAAMGLVNGLNASLPSAYNAGTSLASAVNRGFRNALQIKSPSRVFMDLAKYIPMGIALGIQDNEGYAIDAVTGMSNDLMNTAQRAMAEVGYIASDQYSMASDIVPVIDTEAIRSSMNGISSIFGGSTILDEIRSALSAQSQITQSDINVRSSNQDVVQELRILTDRVSMLGSEISNLKIVMNTGTLVGELAPGMNQALGTIIARQSR